ncbi:glycosyltransferase family 4 protein [Gracilimonas mengyeensis]|uniref:Glycosyltransferase involved in cell wall bisynthesis n=1 Tax=Gracilimonas mengyeensis TaxID=1302730 RepID=A0A521EGT5_9BACT|nr:glycosyltransferase family 4 protein [Gracilimonas mengyeensis]SMO83125.1 Glycosyltransferase involved in cell wall bisynthesis [Gracilimonas mengyeensis]
MSPKKVAITQNRFQRGGRMQVTIQMVKVLNKRGITPDLVCFKSNISKKDINEAYGADISFNFREIFVDPKIPFEWNILLFNLIASFYLKSYDLVINSNNTSFLLSDTLNVLSYVHFPRKKRNIIPHKDIHFPEGAKKSVWDFKSDFLKAAHFLYRFDNSIPKNDLQVANSDFTKKTLTEIYNLPPEKIEVIYPPVNISSAINQANKKKQVVSLGRFSRDKRQLEQIKIARKLPELDFHLYGFVNARDYYQTLEHYIHEHQIQNVYLHPDAPFSEIEKALSESAFFIHSLRNEPFGITSVQAIQHGCVPVVHNSGGQMEIVSEPKLRYNNAKEAIEILRKLTTEQTVELQRLRDILKSGLQAYSAEAFDRQFETLLEAKL